MTCLVVRLERTLNRRVGDKEYHRWRVTDIPNEIVKELGWKADDKVEAEIRGDSLIVRRKKG